MAQRAGGTPPKSALGLRVVQMGRGLSAALPLNSGLQKCVERCLSGYFCSLQKLFAEIQLVFTVDPIVLLLEAAVKPCYC